ncbi:hypothetical protein HaLaN_07323 [Haematococcus lacustris]|uniref:Uncharacterized protein n=1 Tax=Haematococcus lacustris TaxID=44745 RepID=A0A699YNA1_HAELA|nr:hypothetical protein HaLaN_07323 [Haematococcus lacustris]
MPRCASVQIATVIICTDAHLDAHICTDIPKYSVQMTTIGICTDARKESVQMPHILGAIDMHLYRWQAH